MKSILAYAQKGLYMFVLRYFIFRFFFERWMRTRSWSIFSYDMFLPSWFGWNHTVLLLLCFWHGSVEEQEISPAWMKFTSHPATQPPATLNPHAKILLPQPSRSTAHPPGKRWQRGGWIEKFQLSRFFVIFSFVCRPLRKLHWIHTLLMGC